MGLPSIYGLFSSYFSQLHFSKLKIPYFDTPQGHCDTFSVHMPLFVISYLRSVLCTHGCLTCYMLLSVPAAIFADLIFHIPSVLAIANFLQPSRILTVSVFSWCFGVSAFAVFLLMLSRLFYCCFLSLFSYKTRRHEFGIRLTRTRTAVIGRNSPKVITWFRYIFTRKSITHFAYRSPPRRWCIPLTRM